jgi:hypothetical protein
MLESLRYDGTHLWVLDQLLLPGASEVIDINACCSCILVYNKGRIPDDVSFIRSIFKSLAWRMHGQSSER